MNSRTVTRVPTTAAALLRVMADSSTPMRDGRKRDQVDGEAATRAASAGRRDDGARRASCGVEAPRRSTPATVATAADRNSAGAAYVDRRERLRGEHLAAVDRARQDRLEGPVPSSVATMSPDDERRDQREQEGRPKSSISDRRRQARLGDLGGEDAVAWLAVAGRRWLDTKISGTIDRQREAEVRALLRDELAQLPAVDGQHRRACASARARAARRSRRGGDAALRSRHIAARARRPRLRLPGARRRPRSAGRTGPRALQLGVRRRIADPGLPSASDSSPTVALVGLQAEAVLAGAACSTPACARATAQRARVVARAQPVAGPALAAQVGERALVDDAPAVDDRDAVAQFLRPPAAGGSRAAPSCRRRRGRRISARMSRIPAGSRPVAGSSRISSRGLRSSAAAMPRRWRMPCE